MLPIQIAVALTTFIVAGFFLVTGRSPAIVSYHLIFAVGIMPLILAAMMHFIPVLTRSAGPRGFMHMIPLIAMVGGFVAIFYFSNPLDRPFAHYIGIIIALCAVSALVIWAWLLRRKAIGAPHPCMDWYLVAIACLGIGLSAILIGYCFPEQRNALRLFHLHLNTIGFIGITALGTLQVLMPTVTQKPDKDAAQRMRRDLKWVAGGTFISACCAAWHSELAWVGLALLSIPFIHISKAWCKQYAGYIFVQHGASPSLGAALPGLAVVLIIGAIHGQHDLQFNPISAFIIAFLMPLVIGAVSYLLPQWLRPGIQTTWHRTAHERLGFLNGTRALILLIGGVMAGLGVESGWYLALIATSTFALQAISLWSLG